MGTLDSTSLVSDLAHFVRKTDLPADRGQILSAVDGCSAKSGCANAGLAASAVWRLVAVVLLAAAALKFAHMLLFARGSVATPHGAALDLTAAGVETLVAVWMLSRIRPRWSKAAAVCLFAVFLGVSASRGLAGAESCGCFGALRVDPRLMAVVDAAVLALFAVTRAPPADKRLDFRAMLACLGCSSMIATFALAAAQRSAEDGILSLGGEIVVLAPEAWLGKPFPLLASLNDSLNGADGLSVGPWRAVLYHSDCPKCQALIAQYAERRETENETNGNKSPQRIALIEAPPFSAPLEVANGAPFVHFRLSASQRWIAETPTEFDLFDGVVVAVRTPADVQSASVGPRGFVSPIATDGRQIARRYVDARFTAFTVGMRRRGGNALVLLAHDPGISRGRPQASLRAAGG